MSTVGTQPTDARFACAGPRTRLRLAQGPSAGDRRRRAVSGTITRGNPMSSANLHTLAERRPADGSGAAPAQGGPDHRRDPWLRLDADGALTFPLPGQPGHGATSVFRRQPARIVDGRMERGCTGAFELICCQCGDHPYLDYSQISPRLQQIRGPYTMAAGIAA
jgi:hypothetical protein